MARNYRLEIIEALGGQCQWHEGCDVTDPDMLHVDHVYGDGAKERGKYHKTKYWENVQIAGPGGSNGYYIFILKNVHSGRYQLLCANHNVKKHALERRAKKLAKEAAIV